MIMLARVVPYGGNAVRYALEKEKAKMVKVNHMPEGIDPTAIWYMMKHHCELHQQDRTVGRKLERSMVSFVISPSKEEAKDFTMNDWQKLHDETLETLDAIGLIPKGMKKEVKTNFRSHHCPNVKIVNIVGVTIKVNPATVHVKVQRPRLGVGMQASHAHRVAEIGLHFLLHTLGDESDGIQSI